MTEQEILSVVTTYISGHWKEILGAIVTGAATLIGVTWLVSKAWYSREIGHLSSQLNAMKSLHGERTQVLKEKIDERTIYAKGIVEIANQRVLAIEHERSKLLEKISIYESELRSAESVVDQHRSLESSVDGDKILLNKAESVGKIMHLLSSRIFMEDDAGKRSATASKFVELITKEAVSVSIVNSLVPIVGYLVKVAIKSKIESEKSTESLSKFHKSYYKSIENIMTPIADESSSISDLDSKKMIDNEICIIESNKDTDK